MPRQPRLDSPGRLHRVMARGMERTDIFRDDRDRETSETARASWCPQGAPRCRRGVCCPITLTSCSNPANGGLLDSCGA